MPRFNPETIAALAEGRLSPDEAARVEAAIAQDPTALAELEMQRSAIAALSAAPGLHLTELERSGLRASVADALGLVDTAPEVAEEPRRVPWGALGVAAAALAGLVAVVPVVGLLNTGGGADADTALAPTATTNREAADSSIENGSAVAEAPVVSTDDGAFNAGEEAPGDSLLGFGSSTTLAPAPTTTTVPVEEDATTATSVTDSVSTPPLDDLIVSLSALREDPEAIAAVASEAMTENLCWTADTAARGGEDPGNRWSFEYQEGERVVVVYFQYDAEGFPGPFTVYETAECTALVEIPDVP